MDNRKRISNMRELIWTSENRYFEYEESLTRSISNRRYWWPLCLKRSRQCDNKRLFNRKSLSLSFSEILNPIERLTFQCEMTVHLLVREQFSNDLRMLVYVIYVARYESPFVSYTEVQKYISRQVKYKCTFSGTVHCVCASLKCNSFVQI